MTSAGAAARTASLRPPLLRLVYRSTAVADLTIEPLLLLY